MQIDGLGALNLTSGTENLITLKDRHFFKWNSSTSNWDLQTGLGKWLTAGAKAEHVEFVNQQFWCNGNDPCRNYNGSDWSITRNLQGSPIAKYIHLFNNRLYMVNVKLRVNGASGGVISFPSRVWYSEIPEQDADGNWTIAWNFQSGNDLATTAGSSTVNSPSASFVTRKIRAGDPFYIVSGSNAKRYTVAGVDNETSLKLTENVVATGTGQVYWVGGNWFDVAFDDGDVLTGVGSSSSRLLLFKNNSLFRTPFNGDNLEKVKDVPGTASHRSIRNLGDFTYYHHASGIRRYNGVTSEVISEPIWDIIEGISSSNYDDVVAWTDEAHFIKMYVGDVAANLQTDLPAISKCVLVHDVTLDNWSTMSLPLAITVTTPWIESNNHRVYAGITDANSDGDVYQLETGTDFDGTAISFRLRTKVYYPVAPEVTVTGVRFEEYSDKGDNLQVTYRRVRQPQMRDSDFKPISKTFPIHESDFKGIQLEVLESSTKDSFLLEKFTIYFSNPRLEE